MKVRFVRWWYKELHDRHVITERVIDSNRTLCAGVTFGQGLDEAGEKEDIQYVRLTLLDSAAAQSIRNDFIESKPRYTLDPGSTVEVIGTLT